MRRRELHGVDRWHTHRHGDEEREDGHGHLQINYGFAGLQSPYTPPSDRAFKVKSTIPLKWQYTNISNIPVPSPSAAIMGPI